MQYTRSRERRFLLAEGGGLKVLGSAAATFFLQRRVRAGGVGCAQADSWERWGWTSVTHIWIGSGSATFRVPLNPVLPVSGW